MYCNTQSIKCFSVFYSEVLFCIPLICISCILISFRHFPVFFCKGVVKIGAGFSVFGFSACVGILQIKKFVVFLQACLGASLLTREMVHVSIGLWFRGSWVRTPPCTPKAVRNLAVFFLSCPVGFSFWECVLGGGLRAGQEKRH